MLRTTLPRRLLLRPSSVLRALSSPSTSTSPLRRRINWLPQDDLSLSHFLPPSPSPRRNRNRTPLVGLSVEAASLISPPPAHALGAGNTFAIETRGCQMNVADSEVVRSILLAAGYAEADEAAADIVLINTCAIRQKAEKKVFDALHRKRAADRRRDEALSKGERVGRRVYALLGCMAERLKESLLEDRAKLVDVVVGPDGYRDLPLLLRAVVNGEPGAVGYNVQLSVEETYADITPTRDNAASKTAFVSVSRSCNMSCSFCIVPHVRGPERSRAEESILDEVRALAGEGVKEVTLLGQNVSAWRLNDPSARAAEIPLSEAFNLPGVVLPTATRRFPDLLQVVSEIEPEMRVRFTSPHPAHFPEDVLDLIAETPNICSALHLPLQSGSTPMLQRMRRRHTADAYRELVALTRAKIPGVTLSTDLIVGFCNETDEDHAATLDMLRDVGYSQAFIYAYSLRAGTEAAKKMEDNVPHELKMRRLREALDLYHSVAAERNKAEIGRQHLVLVEEGDAKSPAAWGADAKAKTGRTDGNQRVVFRDAPVSDRDGGAPRLVEAGDYVAVRVVNSSSVTLLCEPVERSSISAYSKASSARAQTACT